MPIFFVLLIVLAGVAFFIWSSWKDSTRAQSAQESLTHTNNVIKGLDQVQSLLTESSATVTAYAATGDTTFITTLPTQNNTILASVQLVAHLVADSPPLQTRIQQLEQLIHQKLNYHQQVIQAFNTNPQQAVQLITSPRDKTLMETIKAALANMKADENELLLATTLNNQEAGRKSLQTAIIASLAVLLIIAILVFFLYRDIQLIRKADNELVKSETRYREFVENAGVITYTADINGMFTFISKQVEDLTGYTPEEMMGKHFSTLIREDWIPRVAEKYMEQFTNRTRESNFIFPINYKNNGTRWVEQDAILLEKDGKVQGFQCVVKDVTDQELMRQRLEKSEEEQKEYQYRVQAILDNAPS